ncbi:hypothetical protein HPC49_06400 [Pyxidicoccus fallax]|uniref:DUF7151 domain-containing protein n=1 Tax=Pyxidicoccus fallax TaxID=394095 RepID=A0A848L892_9BACT|nr:hypothetical protein [Pyxidicoccus fallax]NMO14462.1 hypothetical protein [Pyxidicoccus fallax]NPC77884.1 hypothetical protein [Pyxidicoccus fallax]
MRWTWMALWLLTAGCDGIELEQLVKQHPPATRMRPELAGANCPQGGHAVLTGLDLDDDGVLDDDEVRTTTYSCFSARSSLRPEPPGLHCAHGGQAVLTGLDLDDDGVLDDSEVTATDYVCATTVPNVLVRTRQVASGAQCTHGGVVSHAGVDLDGDQLLDDAEITREVYGCSEPAPVLTRVRDVATNYTVCPKPGALVEAAVDLDRDGVFDDTEVRASLEICVSVSQARVRQQPEPAGERCPMGGTAVQAGRDINMDGEFGPNEVLGTTYVCQPTATYDGMYLVRDAADFAALSAISHIRGSLIIANSPLTEVVLPGLVSVEGSLSIDGNPALTRVDLAGLRSVGEALYVADNANLELLRVGPAGPTPPYPVRVGTDLTVRTNGKLTSLFGLDAVAPRHNVSVSSNPVLGGGGRFSYLTDLTGSLVIEGNAALGAVPFSSLRTVAGSVRLVDNDALITFLGLEGLVTVGEDVIIANNASLRSTAELNLNTVGGTLSLTENPALQDFTLGSLFLVGRIIIHRNASLEWVGPMRSLQAVDRDFGITENPKLKFLMEFPMLVSVGAYLQLSDNPLLTDVSVFSRLLRLGVLNVSRSAGLTSLAPFSGLRELDGLVVQENPELTQLGLSGLVQVSSFFWVTDNPKLPGCLATSLADSVYTGPVQDRDIQNNAETACGP